MSKKALTIAAFVAAIFAVCFLASCSELTSVLGGTPSGGTPGGGSPSGSTTTTTLNANQTLLKKLMQSLTNADAAVAAYASTHSGAFPTGFAVSDSGNVRTRTFTNYDSGMGVILNGTDTMTFDSTPPPTGTGKLTAGNMNIGFSGASMTGGPYALILSMVATPPTAPTYTTCTVNGTDMLSDFKSMMISGTGTVIVPSLTANQLLLQQLFKAMDTANMAVQTYAAAHSGVYPTGFSVIDSGYVRTRTFTSYNNGAGATLDGTDTMTFNNTPPPTGTGQLVKGDLSMTFTGSSGGPYTLVLKMTASPPSPPVYSQCTVNGTDMLVDYLGMMAGAPGVMP